VIRLLITEEEKKEILKLHGSREILKEQIKNSEDINEAYLFNLVKDDFSTTLSKLKTSNPSCLERIINCLKLLYYLRKTTDDKENEQKKLKNLYNNQCFENNTDNTEMLKFIVQKFEETELSKITPGEIGVIPNLGIEYKKSDGTITNKKEIFGYDAEIVSAKVYSNDIFLDFNTNSRIKGFYIFNYDEITDEKIKNLIKDLITKSVTNGLLDLYEQKQPNFDKIFDAFQKDKLKGFEGHIFTFGNKDLPEILLIGDINDKNLTQKVDPPIGEKKIEILNTREYIKFKEGNKYIGDIVNDELMLTPYTGGDDEEENEEVVNNNAESGINFYLDLAERKLYKTIYEDPIATLDYETYDMPYVEITFNTSEDIFEYFCHQKYFNEPNKDIPKYYNLGYSNYLDKEICKGSTKPKWD
jgi:hypothetical protein